MRLVLKKLREPSNDYDNTDVTIEADVVSLTDALEVVEGFLRASGFSWVKDLSCNGYDEGSNQ